MKAEKNSLRILTIAAIRKILLTLRGDKRYGYFARAEKMQWKTTEELRRLQLESIKHLVRHAYETTQYYKVVMDDLGMFPGDIKSFEDFARLPVLTKAIVRNQGHELISSSFEKSDLLKNSSGGSTGEPVSFYQDRKLWDKMNGYIMLARSFMGWHPGDMIINIWGNPKDFGKKTSAFGKLKSRFSGVIYLNAYEYNKNVMADWIYEINRYSNSFIYGYPSVLTDIANFILDNEIKLYGVKGVMCSAEKLHEWQRELLLEAFSCPVYDQYGSREIPCIATECEHGKMHLLTHASYIEFVPDPPTMSQKIIATSFLNQGMPFLRYDIGDFGTPVEGACRCGRGFPLLKMDIGRIYDTFLTPEGNAIHGTYFVRLLAAVKGVSSFQFRQKERDRIYLKIVKSEAFSEKSRITVDCMEERIQKDITPSFSLDVQFVDYIPKTGGGKHRYTICEVER